MWVCACLCMHVSADFHGDQKEVLDLLKFELQEYTWVYWELDLRLLQEHQALLTTETSLYPVCFVFFRIHVNILFGAEVIVIPLGHHLCCSNCMSAQMYGYPCLIATQTEVPVSKQTHKNDSCPLLE